MRTLFLTLFFTQFLGGCSPNDTLYKFGDVLASDPKVIDSQLQVKIVNNSSADLCYFDDALFYGSGVIEGSSGSTKILRPATGAESLADIYLASTNRRGFTLKEIKDTEGVVTFNIPADRPIRSGDDLSFPLVFCDPVATGEYQSLVYTSRIP